MKTVAARIKGIGAATLRLGGWFVVFFLGLSVIVPHNLLGWTEPWSMRDIAAAIPLLAGAYQAARHCRFLPLYFAFGAVGGLLYVDVHWPGRNGLRMLPAGPAFWLTFFSKQLAITLGFGAAALLTAAARHWRLGPIVEPDEGHCRKCGYNLTGNVSGRCPECGAAIDVAEPPPAC